jgi:hypothetical protein
VAVLGVEAHASARELEAVGEQVDVHTFAAYALDARSRATSVSCNASGSISWTEFHCWG